MAHSIADGYHGSVRRLQRKQNPPTYGGNMNKALNGKKVAILVADGFEQSELEDPRSALEDAGAKTEIVSPNDRTVVGWDQEEFGDALDVDVRIEKANADNYDALLLPGGVMNPDKLRLNAKAVAFVKSFFDTGKPVAAICHGPQILIDADVVRGRKLTSYPSLRKDLANAGANWLDEVVVVDEGLITSRTPDDIPQFNEKMIEQFAEARQQGGHRPALAGVD
jgi:protease I